MKCYTFKKSWVFDNKDCLKEGIAVEEDPIFGTIVYLGEEGRGRHYEKVGLYRKSPAEVKDRKIFNARPVKITVNRGTEKEKSFYTLAAPALVPNEANKDKRLLVRINTSCTYTRGSIGNWKAVKGEPQTLVVGNGAHGIAGRIGTWYDGLVIMQPGDVLRVKPEGGYKTEHYALFYDPDEGLKCMVWQDYENLCSIQEGEAEVL